MVPGTAHRPFPTVLYETLVDKSELIAQPHSPLRRGAHCASGSWRNGMNTKTTEKEVISPKITTFFTTTNSWWLSDAQCTPLRSGKSNCAINRNLAKKCGWGGLTSFVKRYLPWAWIAAVIAALWKKTISPMGRTGEIVLSLRFLFVKAHPCCGGCC